MRLADFIVDNLDPILTRWHTLTQENAAHPLPGTHEIPMQMLQSIAAQLAAGPPCAPDHLPPGAHAGDPGPASLLGAEELLTGATMGELIGHFHALRASVVGLWREQCTAPSARELDEVLCLNEAIDRAQADAVARFTAMMAHSQHLFLAILGHDLRNPLNATVMGASFLKRAPGIATAHAEVAARIHRSGLRMGRLVEDLIDYTRIHLGSPLPMTLSKCNLGTICRAAMEELRVAHPDRSFQMKQDGDLDGVWDEGRIAQVISNLLGNALQHGARHEAARMCIESGGSDLVVRIHNGGKPIAADALASIFDPLVRFADPRSSRQGADSSLGIGLYITRAIVAAHGGEIRVVSCEEAGTTFSVRLPRIPHSR
jgi:signal transduction histidine kinase